MAFCQFCYSTTARHSRECPDVAMNDDECRRFLTFDPAVSRPSSHAVIVGSVGEPVVKDEVKALHPSELAAMERRSNPRPVAQLPTEKEYDTYGDALAAIKAHHDKRGLPPLKQTPPPPPPDTMPEPAKLIAIDKITGQIYRDLQHTASGCIGKQGAEEFYLPDDSYDVDFE